MKLIYIIGIFSGFINFDAFAAGRSKLVLVYGEKIDCREANSKRDEAGMDFYIGRKLDNGKIQLISRFFVSFKLYLDAGIDSTDWWCVPAKRYCYKKHEFYHWPGPDSPYVEKQVLALSQDNYRVVPKHRDYDSKQLQAWKLKMLENRIYDICEERGLPLDKKRSHRELDTNQAKLKGFKTNGSKPLK